MAKYEQMLDHLPSLYRPQRGDSSLVSVFLQAVARLLDDVQNDMNDIMQGHWYDYSDSALFDPYINLDRKQRELERLNPVKAEHLDIIDGFPYIHDLARLGALMTLPPWREPLPLREKVEEYRQRLGLFVKLYRNGLGTVNALRTVVEAELPPIPELPRVQRERSFSVEEFAPLLTTTGVFEARGAPYDGEGNKRHIVGPLMRWSFNNNGMNDAPLIVYIEGVGAIAGVQDATINPVLELYAGDDQTPRLAIAYQGTISEGNVMRLRPAYQSWLGLQDGVSTTRSEPTETDEGNPCADKDWQTVPDGPTAAVTAMVQSQDRVLWVAVDNEGSGELWRFDGNDWTQPLEGATLGLIHSMAERGQELLLCSSEGLLSLPLYPAEGENFVAAPVTPLVGQAVYCTLLDKDNTLWLGTDNGAVWLNPDNSITASDLQDTPIYALYQDKQGVLYLGGELGLFQWQSGTGHWYWYRGEEESDQVPDWNRYVPGELPQASEVFLPPVTGIYMGLDASLWIGTQHGFARYRARAERGLTYKTLLEAYPDLGDGQVYAVKEDQRGLIWFCTERGLLRYDGRDMAQYQSGAGRWVSQGRADSVYRAVDVQPRDFWRFNRTLDTPAWQYFDRNTGQWTTYSDSPSSEAENPVRAVLWTDSVAADLGTWMGDEFSPGSAVSLSDLRVRVKPDDTRIVDGGLPAVPRLPQGDSTWRYLSLETEGMPLSENRPWWTREGRLLLPPDQAAPYPGRYGEDNPIPKPLEQIFDSTVFAYNPSAKVWLQWSAKRTFTVMVRLQKVSASEAIHPAIIDRVWQGMEKVRPAGIRVMLAVEEQIVRGE